MVPDGYIWFGNPGAEQLIALDTSGTSDAGSWNPFKAIRETLRDGLVSAGVSERIATGLTGGPGSSAALAIDDVARGIRSADLDSGWLATVNDEVLRNTEADIETDERALGRAALVAAVVVGGGYLTAGEAAATAGAETAATAGAEAWSIEAAAGLGAEQPGTWAALTQSTGTVQQAASTGWTLRDVQQAVSTASQVYNLYNRVTGEDAPARTQPQAQPYYQPQQPPPPLVFDVDPPSIFNPQPQPGPIALPDQGNAMSYTDDLGPVFQSVASIANTSSQAAQAATDALARNAGQGFDLARYLSELFSNDTQRTTGQAFDLAGRLSDSSVGAVQQLATRSTGQAFDAAQAMASDNTKFLTSVLDRTQRAQDQSTGLVAAAFNDAKGRGALTDYITLAAIAGALLVAFAALRRGS